MTPRFRRCLAERASKLGFKLCVPEHGRLFLRPNDDPSKSLVGTLKEIDRFLRSVERVHDV